MQFNLFRKKDDLPIVTESVYIVDVCDRAMISLFAMSKDLVVLFYDLFPNTTSAFHESIVDRAIVTLLRTGWIEDDKGLYQLTPEGRKWIYDAPSKYKPRPYTYHLKLLKKAKRKELLRTSAITINAIAIVVLTALQVFKPADKPQPIINNITISDSLLNKLQPPPITKPDTTKPVIN